MNEFIKLQVSNVHTIIWDFMLQSGDISTDELFNLERSKLIIQMYYEDIIKAGITNYL
jgi:hypothetical protein